jgi:hypothetical protein
MSGWVFEVATPALSGAKSTVDRYAVWTDSQDYARRKLRTHVLRGTDKGQRRLRATGPIAAAAMKAIGMKPGGIGRL